MIDYYRAVLVVSCGRSCRASLPRACIRDSTSAAESSETHSHSFALSWYLPALAMGEREAMWREQLQCTWSASMPEAVVNSSTVHSTATANETITIAQSCSSTKKHIEGLHLPPVYLSKTLDLVSILLAPSCALPCDGCLQCAKEADERDFHNPSLPLHNCLEEAPRYMHVCMPVLC